MRIYAIFFLLFFVEVVQAQSITPSGEEIELDPRLEPDIKRKSLEIRRLTKNAVRHFLNNSIEVACNDFVHSAQWRKGELFIFVYDKKGNCLAHGDDTYLIWKNISDVKGRGGIPLIQQMLRLPGKGGAISYLWDNAYKSSYIEKVQKGKETYIIGSGFFPEADEFAIKQLVKTAAAYFQQNGKEATFALINNPKGPFVKGDLYLAAYDFKGITEAHGQNAALVGQNRYDEVDARGKPLIQMLIQVAQTKGYGWVEYYWRNEFKRGYVERVTDPKTKKRYLITGGYYPNLTLQVARNFVARAIEYLKSQGSKVAFAEFSNQVGKFVKGSLGIFVFNLEGKCLADGQNPSFVGQNLLKSIDQDGQTYVKDIISTARRHGRGYVTFSDYNARAIAYVELVDVPDGKFIIGTTYFPDSKIQATQTLVIRALSALRQQEVPEAFRAFVLPTSDFRRGDLSIFVYDTTGTRYVNGFQTTEIWQNFLRTSDQSGRAIIQSVISTAAKGGGWIEFKIRNATRRLYVKSIQKPLEDGDMKTFVVGSGYFM